jgi:hypothetical protein
MRRDSEPHLSCLFLLRGRCGFDRSLPRFADRSVDLLCFQGPERDSGSAYRGSNPWGVAAESRGWPTAIDASTGALKWKYESKRPMVAAVTVTKAVHTTCPAQNPEAHAHWKLNPPSCPVTSTTSPMKYKPGVLRLSIVLAESSRVSTPPIVTSALA